MMVLMAKRVPCQDYIDVEAKKRLRLPQPFFII